MRLGPVVSVNVDLADAWDSALASASGFDAYKIQNVNSIFISDILNNLCDLIFGLRSN